MVKPIITISLSTLYLIGFLLKYQRTAIRGKKNNSGFGKGENDKIWTRTKISKQVFCNFSSLFIYNHRASIFTITNGYTLKLLYPDVKLLIQRHWLDVFLKVVRILALAPRESQRIFEILPADRCAKCTAHFNKSASIVFSKLMPNLQRKYCFFQLRKARSGMKSL